MTNPSARRITGAYEQIGPTQLHRIIGTSTEWADDLWDEALTYLLDRAGTLDVLTMVEVLPDSVKPRSPHKIDYLRVFRNYPPTFLLGAFDYMRKVKKVM